MRKLLLHFILGLPLMVFFSHTASAQWVQTNGPCDGWVQSLAVSGSNIFAGTIRGIFLSTNNGVSWNAVNSGLMNTDILSFAVSGNNIFAGTRDSGVFLSTNNGTSWAAINSGLTKAIVYSLAMCGENIFAGTWGSGVYLSTNNGTSWTAINSGLTDIYVSSLVMCGGNIFAGIWGSGVYLSTNNGTSWTAVNSGLTITNVYSLTASGSNIFAGTDSCVFLSTNDGTSWNKVDSGFTFKNASVRSFAVNGGNIIAGGNGVYLSTNNGTSWNEVDSGILHSDVMSLAVSGGHIFAGTLSAGLWRRPLSEIMGVFDQRSPRETILHPYFKVSPLSRAGSIVTIEFNIPHSDHVVIKTYDLAGKVISSIVNQQLKAGSYRYSWDTHSIARGCYVVRMQAGATIFIKTIQILQ